MVISGSPLSVHDMEGLAATADHAARGKAHAVSEGCTGRTLLRNTLSPHALLGPSPGPLIRVQAVQEQKSNPSVIVASTCQWQRKRRPEQSVAARITQAYRTVRHVRALATTAPRFVELDQSSTTSCLIRLPHAQSCHCLSGSWAARLIGRQTTEHDVGLRAGWLGRIIYATRGDARGVWSPGIPRMLPADGRGRIYW